MIFIGVAHVNTSLDPNRNFFAEFFAPSFLLIEVHPQSVYYYLLSIFIEIGDFITHYFDQKDAGNTIRTRLIGFKLEMH